MTPGRVLRAAEHRVMPWANGGGVTREVFAASYYGDDWVWRVSIADVASDGPFSVFPGVRRTIALVEGAGFELTIDSGAPTLISQPFEPFVFDGGAETSCRLLSGAVIDLNLMSRDHPATLTIRHMSGHEMVLEAAPLLLLVVEGAISCGGTVLERFDAVVWPSPGSSFGPVGLAPARSSSGSDHAVIALIANEL